MTLLQSIKRFYFIPFAFSALLFVSCQNEDKKTDGVADQGDAVPEMTLEQKKAQLQSVSPRQNTTQQPGKATAQPGKASGNINPPHGQPGHRCDIAVGAPLPGTATADSPKPAVNPAHGQPHHRCDIKVGDPLP